MKGFAVRQIVVTNQKKCQPVYRFQLSEQFVNELRDHHCSGRGNQ